MAAFSKNEATFNKPYYAMLAEKIQKKEKVKFISGGDQVIKITAPVKEFIKAVLTNNDQKVLNVIYPKAKWEPIFNGMPWTKIDKAPFSGKGGSGGGAEVTALTESMQCYVCAYLWNVKKKPLTQSDMTKSNLEKAKKFVNADRTLEQCLSKGPADWMDNGVYVSIANVLYTKYKSKMSGTVMFHRGSPFMNNLYKAKAECHTKDRKSETPKAPGSFSNDKWNPGDIWATTLSSSSTPLSKHTSDWGKLNEEVARLAGVFGGPTTLLGISLKKSLSPKVVEYRNPSSKPKPSVKYGGYMYGKTGDFFSSQDIYIHSSAAEVQCRTFGGATSWQGEIKGKMAAGGKIGGGNIDFYAKETLKQSVFGNGSESSLIAQINIKDEKFMKKFYKMYVDGNKNQMSPQKTVSYDEFVKLVRNHPQKSNFYNSKWVCLHLIEALNKSSSAQRDKFMLSIFRYASSDTDQSSYYVKVF